MNSPSSPAKPMAEMTPGSFVPFEGGPVQHFEREPDSPFEDGYSLERERQHDPRLHLERRGPGRHAST